MKKNNGACKIERFDAWNLRLNVAVPISWVYFSMILGAEAFSPRLLKGRKIIYEKN